nr:AAA family ATPase [Humibacillus xanthopallidus]
MLLVSAGAGWGKSTLLVQRTEDLESDGVQVAWVTVPAHASAQSVWSSVLVALQERFAGSFPEAAAALGDLALPSARSTDEFVSALAGVLAGAAPIALVVDELQHAPADAVALLFRVVEEVGPETRFLFGTRWDPNVPLGRWQAQGMLHQVRGADLAFDEQETAAVLALHAAGIDDDVAVEVHRLTEGWPVAVALAGSALEHHTDPHLFVKEFATDTRPMADYLVTELFGDLGDELAQYLLDVCAPDEVTVDLALALTGRADGGAVLARWATTSAMVARYDHEPVTYRLHSLLRAYLRAEARRRDLPRWRRSNRIAAQWFADRGSLTPSLAAAGESHDWMLLTDLLERHGLELVMGGEIDAVRGALAALPHNDDATRLASRLEGVAAMLGGDLPGLRRSPPRLRPRTRGLRRLDGRSCSTWRARDWPVVDRHRSAPASRPRTHPASPTPTSRCSPTCARVVEARARRLPGSRERP